MRTGRSYTLALGRLLGADQPASVNLLAETAQEVSLVPTFLVASDTEENASHHVVFCPAVPATFSVAFFTWSADWVILRGDASLACAWDVNRGPPGFAISQGPAYSSRGDVGVSLATSAGAVDGPFALQSTLPANLVIPAGDFLGVQSNALNSLLVVSLWVRAA